MAKVDAQQKLSVKGKGFLFDRNSEDKFSARVITVNGYVTSEQMQVIAEGAKKYGDGSMGLTTRLSVEIQGVPYDNIEPLTEFLKQNGIEVGGTGDRIRPVVSCKGATCVFGLLNSGQVAKEIHERFFLGYRPVELGHKFKIAVGGCPNNCVKPDLNDIGLIGAKSPVVKEDVCKACGKCLCETACLKKAAKKSEENGKMAVDTSLCDYCGKCIKACPFGAVETKQEGVKVLIGGRWGRAGRKGTLISGIYSAEQGLDMIEKIILYYRENAFKKERFADMIDRIGFDNVEDAILNQDILGRKDEILAKEIVKR